MNRHYNVLLGSVGTSLLLTLNARLYTAPTAPDTEEAFTLGTIPDMMVFDGFAGLRLPYAEVGGKAMDSPLGFLPANMPCLITNPANNKSTWCILTGSNEPVPVGGDESGIVEANADLTLYVWDALGLGEQRQVYISVPNGELIRRQSPPMPTAAKPKRARRSKEEIAAEKAAKAATGTTVSGAAPVVSDTVTNGSNVGELIAGTRKETDAEATARFRAANPITGRKTAGKNGGVSDTPSDTGAVSASSISLRDGETIGQAEDRVKAESRVNVVTPMQELTNSAKS